MTFATVKTDDRRDNQEVSARSRARAGCPSEEGLRAKWTVILRGYRARAPYLFVDRDYLDQTADLVGLDTASFVPFPLFGQAQ